MTGVHKIRRLPPLEPWEDLAACRDIDNPVIFDVTDNYEAKEYCESCPVRNDCLNFAIRNDMQGGIWGGMSDAERKRYARGRVA